MNILTRSQKETTAKTDRSSPQNAPLLGSLLRTGFVRFGSASGTVILSIVLTRTLSKSDFGLFSFCMFILMMLSMVSRYGLESVLLRFGGAAWHARETTRFHTYSAWAFFLTGRNAILLSLIGCGILLCCGAPWRGTSLMLCLLLALLPWSLLYTISFIFKAAHRTPTGSLFEVGSVNHLIWLTVGAMTLLNFEVTAFHVACILLACSVGVFAFGLYLLNHTQLWPKRSKQTKEHYEEFTYSCRSVVVIVIMQMLANMGGIFFLGLLWGDKEVAIYAAPLRLATATIMLTTIVTQVISPRLSGLFKAGEHKLFRQTLTRGTLAVVGVNIPLLTIIAAAAPWIMQLMGPKYIADWPLLSTIAVGQIIGITAGLAPTVLCMTGLENLWSKVTICNGIVCIALTVLLCYLWGAMGAAIGTAYYQASQTWLAAIIVKKRFGYWPVPNLVLLRTDGVS